jgi:hypothetical protein
MPDADLIAAKNTVECFSRRLNARIHDVAVHGGFSDVYRHSESDMRRRAQSGPHPVVNTIISDMLMQFLSYHDMETVRQKAQTDPRFAHHLMAATATGFQALQSPSGGREDAGSKSRQ